METRKRALRAVVKKTAPGPEKAGPPNASESDTKWRKAPEELVELFDRITKQFESKADRKKMFGFPCIFVNGNMFSGLHQENLLLRLSEPDREELLKVSGASIFSPMPGRLMKEYVVVPPSLIADEGKLKKWIARSYEYAFTLAPKTSR